MFDNLFNDDAELGTDPDFDFGVDLDFYEAQE